MIRVPVDAKPLAIIYFTTQDRIVLKFNHAALKKMDTKPGYHVKFGVAKNRIYFDKARRDEKEIAWKICQNGPNGYICVTGREDKHKEFSDLINNGNYGFFYMYYDSAREMWYIDLNKRCYENLRRKHMNYNS